MSRTRIDAITSPQHLAQPSDRPLEPGSVPAFSIVIAAYNAEETIAETIDSALDQTTPAREVIVCDDGSTDETAAIIERRFGDRVTLIRQSNRGQGTARNVAARAASGDFIAILDSDDLYAPGRLAALGELAVERPDLDMLVADAYMERDGEIVGRYYRDQARFVTDDQRHGIIRRNFVFIQTALRRDRMLALGGFDESIGGGAEDINLWMRMILSGSRAGLVDEPLGTYRLRAGSSSDRYVDHLRWTVTSIEAATAPIRDQLSRDERETLDWRLGVLRHDAALAGLEQALLSNGPRRRRRAASIAIGRGFSARTRARALAAAAAPGVAARAVRRRNLDRGRSRVVRPMPRL